MSEYNHPQWQRRRLEIMNRDHWQCLRCGDDSTTLNVHHRRYVKGRRIWEYDDEDLGTFCEPCHEFIHGLHQQAAPMPLALIPFDRHGFMHLINGLWVCSCGCGMTKTRQEFNPV